MSTEANIFLSIVIVSVVSLVGVLAFLLPALRRHGVLLVLVAFAAGTLLGDSFFHLLPEGVEFHQGFPTELTVLILLGFLAFFVLETLLRWGHAHGEEAHPHAPVVPTRFASPQGIEAAATSSPSEAARGAERPSRIVPFAWTNLVGDGLHNFVDGALIAASFYASPALGIATTIAVAAHEIPQELGDFAVLVKAGLRPARALFYNFLSALLAVLGGLMVVLLPLDPETLERIAVPLIAGGFIYIAAADLVPELHHHSDIRHMPILFLALAAGLSLMGGLLFLE